LMLVCGSCGATKNTSRGAKCRLFPEEDEEEKETQTKTCKEKIQSKLER